MSRNPGPVPMTQEERSRQIHKQLKPVKGGHLHWTGPRNEAGAVMVRALTGGSSDTTTLRRRLWEEKHGAGDLARRKREGLPSTRVGPSCGDPDCFAVDHLEAYSVRDFTPPRSFCDQGHEKTEDNTVWMGKQRTCRICRADRLRKELDQVLSS